MRGKSTFCVGPEGKMLRPVSWAVWGSIIKKNWFLRCASLAQNLLQSIFWPASVSECKQASLVALRCQYLWQRPGDRTPNILHCTSWYHHGRTKGILSSLLLSLQSNLLPYLWRSQQRIWQVEPQRADDMLCHTFCAVPPAESSQNQVLCLVFFGQHLPNIWNFFGSEL